MKKMRKLIPAFAMLMVAAIMMTTASFAWFTMNDEVTATGMQIQAKATGSLVISDEELTYASKDTTVDLATGVKKLTPITLKVENDKGAWYIPEDGLEVDPVSGQLKDTELVDARLTDGTKSAYFFDEVVYIGSAGDTLTGKSITVSLSALAAEAGTKAYLAYSAAIYVMVDGSDPAIDAKPDGIVHVDPKTENGSPRNEAVLTNGSTGYTIPSVVGVGDQNENTTGLKVVIRIFVDGDLASLGDDKKPVPDGTYTYTAVEEGADYDASVSYFYEVSDGVYTAANLDNLVEEEVEGEEGEEATTKLVVPAGWFTREANTVSQNYNYVNSKEVPSAATSLEIGFKTN